MNISINEKVLQKYNLSIEEFMVLYLCSKEVDIENTINSLINKDICERNLYNKIAAVTSNNTKDLIAAIIVSSDKAVVDKDEEFLELASKMRLIFPKGCKAGTSYQWRDSAGIVANKLKTVVAKFGIKFSEDEALKATERYVKSFNGDYKFMELLKYFILKTDRNTGELKSNFMSYLENDEEDDNSSFKNDNGELV